jgi:ankyrin repeat protein
MMSFNISFLSKLLPCFVLMASLPSLAQIQTEQVQPVLYQWLSAAAQGDQVSIERLLASGYDVNAAEPVRGVTALHNAAANGHDRLVQLLLKQDIKLHAVDFQGVDALSAAIYGGHLAVVKTLLNADSRQRGEEQAGLVAAYKLALVAEGQIVSQYLLPKLNLLSKSQLQDLIIFAKAINRLEVVDALEHLTLRAAS